MENHRHILQSRFDSTEQPAFVFKKRRENINWRLLAAINVDKIVRENDIKGLQDILENLTFCDIEKEDFKNLDPNYIKLFQLAQLVIEYLLHTQETIIQTKHQEEKLFNSKEKSKNEIIEKCKQFEDQVHQLTKENRQLKKTVYAFQLWSKIPGGIGSQGGLPGAPMLATSYSRCRYCGKVFSGEYYLDAHLDRRHGDRPNYVRESENNHPQIINIPNPDAGAGVTTEILDKITSTIEKFSSKVLDTERSLRMDLERRMADALGQKEQMISEAFKKDRLGYEKELQELKTMMSRQLEDERRLLREERMALDEMYSRQTKRSNVGVIEDDDDSSKKEGDLIKKLEKKYDEAFERLTSTLEKELSELKKGKEVVIKSADDGKVDQLELEKNQLSRDLYSTNLKVRQLEELLERISTKEVLKPQPSLDKWQTYVELMANHKNSPYTKNTMIKSKYAHHGVLLAGKRKEVEVMFDSEIQKRGLTPEIVTKNPTKVLKLLEKERAETEAQNPYQYQMRQHILSEIDAIVGQKFVMKPSALIIPANGTGFLPHKKDFFGSATLFSDDGRDTSLSRRSVRSSASSVKWDDDSVSESSESLADDVSEISAMYEKKFDPKKSFGKAFAVFKASKAFEKPENKRKESLDPILKTAIGRVKDAKSRKDPLEKRKESLDEYQTSDISESMESLEKDQSIARSDIRNKDSLEDLDLSDDLETEHLA